MNLLLSDNKLHLRFAPLTLTRPLAELRCGIYTNTERWKLLFPEATIGFETEQYLQKKFPSNQGIWINAQCIANEQLAEAIASLDSNQSLYLNELCIAFKGDGQFQVQHQDSSLIILENRWDLYLKNDQILEQDFKMATLGRKSCVLEQNNLLIGSPKGLFIEEGAKIKGATLNTETGPIYIGKNVEIMEGSLLRGPLAILDGAVIKMGAKVYGATTIGPQCRIGGELSNCLFQGFSNKGHDGFLGNALIGEWCNLGANTSCSNLKNNYGKIKTYNYELGQMQLTSEQFMGLSMGDFSKSAIHVPFNTASVVGVSANIFCSGFPNKYVPSFQWLSDDGMIPYNLSKSLQAASAMLARRNRALDELDREILEYLAIN